MEIRQAVRENRLSDPAVVSAAAYRHYLPNPGWAWVATVANQPVGFAVVDWQAHAVWALFVHPDYAQQGIGKRLHKVVLDAYFAANQATLSLSTDPSTRAEVFYRLQGWTDAGCAPNGEQQFCMTRENWEQNKHEKNQK